MHSDPFDTWRRRGSAAGQRQLANTIRTLVFRADESLFDRLDFDDDAQFLHPCLFAYFTDPAPCVGLPQALYGLMPRDNRPTRIAISTDPAGRAFLGPIGAIATGLPSCTLEFGRDGRDAPYTCITAAGAVPFHLRAPLVIPGTRIEVTTDLDPLFRRFYGGDAPVADPSTRWALTGCAPREPLCHLMLAAALLRAHCPAVWAELAAVTRLIVLYAAATPHSFAALSAHGAIFCNVCDGEGEIALLEDLAHQGAHVLFNAFSHNPARVLTLDPHTPIRNLSSEAGETRTLYEAFHGLFTYTMICRVLSGVYQADALCELQSHEVLGRLGFTLQKFESDLARLRLPDAYTLAGRRCYAAFEADFASLRARYGVRVGGFAYDNQSYVFDYQRFVTRNGGPWPALHDKAIPEIAACEMAS